MFIKKDRHNKIVKAKEEEITELMKESKVLYEENKELRCENQELKYFSYQVASIVNTSETIVSKYDKIKELVDQLEATNNFT